MTIKIEFECKDFELTPELEEHLQSIRIHPGWPIVKTLIKQKFAISYDKLRNFDKDDTEYAALCGYLDALEDILNEFEELENK